MDLAVHSSSLARSRELGPRLQELSSAVSSAAATLTAQRMSHGHDGPSSPFS